MMSFRKPRQPLSTSKGKKENPFTATEESITTSDEMPGPGGEVPLKKQKKGKNPTHITFSDSGEDSFIDDPSDTDYWDSVPSDGKNGNIPASNWNYSDLKQTNIFFDERSEIFEDFMLDVKEDILKKYPRCPDYSECVNTFSHLLKENVVFSYELEGIRELRKHMYKNKMAMEQKMMKDIQSDVQKAEIVEKSLDLKDMLNRKWFPAVKRFAYQTMKLIKKALYPLEEGNETTWPAGSDDKTKSEEENNATTLYRDVDENFFQHFCSIFGQLFFLEPDAVNRKTFYFNEKKVFSTPDLAYSLHMEPFAGVTDVQDTILFVIGVKKKPVRVKGSVSVSLEKQVGPKVLGQVGSELFAGTNFSILKPNSLGIVCMETRVIFVYLKMPEDHYVNVLLGEPLKTKGTISYTQSFDMLNAEDRSKIAGFMYFLGCVQNCQSS